MLGCDQSRVKLVLPWPLSMTVSSMQISRVTSFHTRVQLVLVVVKQAVHATFWQAWNNDA